MSWCPNFNGVPTLFKITVKVESTGIVQDDNKQPVFHFIAEFACGYTPSVVSYRVTFQLVSKGNVDIAFKLKKEGPSDFKVH